MKKILLQDGNQIPCMGFGCYNAFGEEISQAVRMALEAGYRYIDSAQRYQNEAAVGEAIADCSLAREEFFVLSKVWPTYYDKVEIALERSLKRLRVEYLDYYLIHWPALDEAKRLHAYEQILDLQRKGYVRTAGVSNFLPDQLEVLKAEFGAYPAINELEIHPSYQQHSLVSWCHERGIQTISYSPINRNADLQNDIVKEIAAGYGKTAGQVVLRWHLQKGQIPIPKSSNPGRIRENIDLFDFELTKEEMAAIDALECGGRSGQDPLTFDGGGQFTEE